MAVRNLTRPVAGSRRVRDVVDSNRDVEVSGELGVCVLQEVSLRPDISAGLRDGTVAISTLAVYPEIGGATPVAAGSADDDVTCEHTFSGVIGLEGQRV